jgi:magnesium-transporting ATPase (P-type)
MYNIVFSAIPIMWFALFDYQETKEKFMSDPKLYDIGIKHKCFSTKVFWVWFSYGAIQALVLVLVCIRSIEVSPTPEGKTVSLWMSGSLVYAGVVIIANLKILGSFHLHSFWSVLIIMLSICTYFVSFYVFSLIPNMNYLYGLFPGLMNSPLTYFSLLFCFMMVFSFDKIGSLVRNEIEERLEKKEEMEKKEEEEYFQKLMDASPFGSRGSFVRRNTGYAFAEEDTHAPSALTDNLRKATIKKLGSYGV